MRILIYTLICLWGVVACSPQTAVSTIDTATQQTTDSLLKQALCSYNADWGVAMVMEVETGKVLSQVAIERKDSAEFAENTALLSMPQEQGSLFIPVSMLIALNDGVVVSTDSIDTDNGIWSTGSVNIVDPNFSKGGYGTISASQIVSFSSNVGIAKVIDRGYKDNYSKFRVRIEQVGWNLDTLNSQYGKLLEVPQDNSVSKTTLYWNAIGYETRVSPVGMLTFYNAVANSGKMVLPQTEYRSTTVLNEAIASPKAIKSLREMLVEVVESGTGAPIRSEKVKIAAKTGTAQVGNERGYQDKIYLVSSCGYFPAENPKYSCIVTLYNPKEGYPSGGTMAGTIVRKIAEYISLKQSD